GLTDEGAARVGLSVLLVDRGPDPDGPVPLVGQPVVANDAQLVGFVLRGALVEVDLARAEVFLLLGGWVEHIDVAFRSLPRPRGPERGDLLHRRVGIRPDLVGGPRYVKGGGAS